MNSHNVKEIIEEICSYITEVRDDVFGSDDGASFHRSILWLEAVSFVRHPRVEQVGEELAEIYWPGEPNGNFVYDCQKIRELIRRAEEGDMEADIALREAAARLLDERRTLPDELADYISRIVREGRGIPVQRGRNKMTKITRDLILAESVGIALGHGLRLTRNRSARESTSSVSACSLVAEALHHVNFEKVSEDAIEKICRKYKMLLRKDDRKEIADLFRTTPLTN